MAIDLISSGIKDLHRITAVALPIHQRFAAGKRFISRTVFSLDKPLRRDRVTVLNRGDQLCQIFRHPRCAVYNLCILRCSGNARRIDNHNGNGLRKTITLFCCLALKRMCPQFIRGIRTVYRVVIDRPRHICIRISRICLHSKSEFLFDCSAITAVFNFCIVDLNLQAFEGLFFYSDSLSRTGGRKFCLCQPAAVSLLEGITVFQQL